MALRSPGFGVRPAPTSYGNTRAPVSNARISLSQRDTCQSSNSGFALARTASVGWEAS
jgi:hypothetical protein